MKLTVIFISLWITAIHIIHDSNITLKIGDNKQTKVTPMPTHDEAFAQVINFLLSGP